MYVRIRIYTYICVYISFVNIVYNYIYIYIYIIIILLLYIIIEHKKQLKKIEERNLLKTQKSLGTYICILILILVWE